jgi:hypothetical protein
MPEQLFNLTLVEFYDMVNAKLYYLGLDEDKTLQRTAWQTSLLMTATGNYGKKGVEPKKLYKPVFDEKGNFIEDSNRSVKKIDKDEKDKKLNELLAKFNKDVHGVTKDE